MKRILFSILLLFSIFSFNVYSQWISNPGINTQLCNATGSQTEPVVVSDGSGGIITAWGDNRNVNDTKIYVQRYNNAGIPQWQPNGVMLSSTQNGVNDMHAIPDGSGGAIICWRESRNATVAMYYTRKINSAGVPQWTSEVGVTEPYIASNDDERVDIVSDGNGGVFLAYKRYNNAVSKFEIHCQYISWDGTRNFGSNGSVVATSVLSISFHNPKICPDGTGGAIVVYERNSRIYAQKLNNLGVKQWGSDGIDSYGLTVGNMFVPAICSDGVGGAIIINIDQRIPSNNFDIYAQRVKNGTYMWGAGGKPIAVGTARQWNPKIVSDFNFGAYIAWDDERESSDSTKPYLQRIDISGNTYFQSNGIRVNPYCCGLAGLTCPDSSSVYIVTAKSYYPSLCLNAQKISNFGSFPWGIDHIPLSTVLSEKHISPNSITCDISGSLICVWDDFRSSQNLKIFGHKIQPSGLTGITGNSSNPLKFSLEQNYPNPFNPVTSISYSIPAEGLVTLKVYDITGKAVSVLVNEFKPGGSHTVEFNASSLSSGIYLYNIQTAAYSETKKMILVK